MIRLNVISELMALAAVASLLSITCAFAGWQKDGNAVCVQDGSQMDVSIASDGARGAIMCWPDRRADPTDDDLYAQRIDSLGTVVWDEWGEWGRVICEIDSFCSSNPRIVADGDGGGIIVWEDYRKKVDWDIYAQRVNASGDTLWAGQASICTASADQMHQQIISDGEEGAIITWDDLRNGNYDIYAQRVDSSGTAQWATDGVTICTATGSQWFPQVAPDGANGAIIVWTDQRSGESDIYAQRVNASGDTLWTAGGVAICAATGSQTSPRITPSVYGSAAITWIDQRNVNEDVYAQRINPAGNASWTADGVAVCTDLANQTSLEIASDGTGGAIIGWVDGRNGNKDIYVQRVDSTGSVEWTANGVAVCSAAYDQQWPKISFDGAGGAIVAWQDYRSDSTSDIYAQRIDSTGVVLWKADGVALCDTSDEQMDPALVVDGESNAIVAWADRRRGANYDIFAARVWAQGGTETWGTPFFGTVSNDTTWYGSVYVPGDVVVSSGDTLTLAPGCFVRFRAKGDSVNQGVDDNRCELIVDGTLIADGTSGNQIVLTSAASYPATPDTNDWRGLRLRPTSADNLIDNCVVRYAYTGIECESTTATVSSSVVSEFVNDGIKAIASSMTITQDSIALGETGTRGIELTSNSSGTVGASQAGQHTIITAASGDSVRYGIEVKDGSSPAIQYVWITDPKYGMKCSGSSSPSIAHNKLSGTSGNGIQCAGDAVPTVRYTTIQDFQGTGVTVIDTADPDLGAPPDSGSNRIFSSQSFNYWVANLTENTVKAEYNWWGTVKVKSTKFYGDVDYSPICSTDVGTSYGLPRILLPPPASQEPYVVQNYPNPFNPQTTIEYGVNQPGLPVRILVYDATGRVVKTLADERMPAGPHRVLWDGRNEQGERLASGIYFCEVIIGKFREAKKLVLLR